MKIEQLGFYLTRGGDLQQVLCILPDSFESNHPVIAINAYGGPDVWPINGLYIPADSPNGSDLVRYLPTVKSFSDPIPATVKQSLTVDIPTGFVLLPADQPKKVGDKFRLDGSSVWHRLDKIYPGDNDRKLSGTIYITPAPEPVPPKTKTVTEWLCKRKGVWYSYWEPHVKRPDRAVAKLRTIEVLECQ